MPFYPNDRIGADRNDIQLVLPGVFKAVFHQGAADSPAFDGAVHNGVCQVEIVTVQFVFDVAGKSVYLRFETVPVGVVCDFVLFHLN